MAPKNPIARFGSGKQAGITFTLDFHELVSGDLLPGARCGIRYDPLRLVPRDNGYVHGDPERPVTMHFRFTENGPIHDQVLLSPIGMVRDAVVDITGQGSMLHAEIFIPDAARELIVWFSYTDGHGEVHYDSDYGKNYRFRFVKLDIDVLQAVVTSDPQTPYSGFGVEVATAPSVTQVFVRFIAIDAPSFPKSTVPLTRTGATPEGRSLWSAFGIAVPYRATIRFKIFYVIGGVRYKDDNGGKYYIAPFPQ